MNSLVVLLSVVALAAAKPSHFYDPGVIAYSAPIIAAAPSAVSHQSRLDIKSSPAVVATAAIAPIATRTVIAQPTLLTAPAAVSSQSRIDLKTSPAIVETAAIAPIAARTVIAQPGLAAIAAPAAVSSQSRIDIKSSPAVVATAAVAPVATRVIAEPAVYAAYAAPSAVSSQSRIDIKSTPAIASSVFAAAPVAYSAPIGTFVKTAAIATPVIKTAAFVPAPIGARILPIDTPEVIAARNAHFEAQAKVLAGTHILHKRSAPVLAATPLVSTYAATPVISSYASAPLTYAPLAYSSNLAIATPVISKAYGLHPW